MVKQRSDQALGFVLGAMDLAVTVAAWLAAYFLRWNPSLAHDQGHSPPLWWCVRTMPIVVVSALLCYRMSGLYELGRRLSWLTELGRIIRGAGLALLVVLAATFYLQNPYQSRAVTLLFFVMTTAGLWLTRLATSGWLAWQRKYGRLPGRSLIVGTGRGARRLERVLRRNDWMGVTPLGFIAEDGPTTVNTPVVGTIDDLPSLVEVHGIEYVYVALPFERYEQTRRVVATLSNSLVEVRVVPDVPRLAALTVEHRDLEGLPVLHLRLPPHGIGDVLLKRAMDIVLSAILLIVLAPLLALIAFFVKLSDGGPVFYRQERMGLNGRRFWMLKFRTMRVDAETETGPVWAKSGDDRRTALGSFLRGSSLDELPQLWNVLVGEMTLVGPRPERPYFIDNFRQSIPRYMLRHTVKAGMTGWAQVNGWRGDTSLRKRLQYDLYYITHWSIWLDLKILFATALRIPWDKNAY